MLPLVLSILQIFACLVDVSGFLVFLSFFSHESPVRQSFTERRHSWWAERDGINERWPLQIWYDLRATPSPMIELNTKASMVQGLRLKSRDTLVSEQFAHWANTRIHICVHMSEPHHSSLSFSDLLPLQKSLLFPSLWCLTSFFHESEQFLSWMQLLVEIPENVLIL